MTENIRYSPEAERTFMEIDNRVGAIYEAVRSWRGWRLVSDPASDSVMFRAVVREIFYAVHMYQADTTEAGFRMIERLPKREVKLIQVLTHHKAEEAEHGVWAFEDFVALGGNPGREARRPQTAATFAVAAVWWWMQKQKTRSAIWARSIYSNISRSVGAAMAA